VTRWLGLRTRHDAPANLVAAQNDEMAIGAREALRQGVPESELALWMSLSYLGSVCSPDTGPKWIRQGLLTASIIKAKVPPPERTLLSPTSCPEIEKLVARPAASFR
jgi:hypothetical protein